MKINMKHVINISVILIIGLIILYKIPVDIDRTYEGYVLSTEDESLDSQEVIHLEGKLYRNLLSTNSFNGTISIGEYSMDIETGKVRNIRDIYPSLKHKLTNERIFTMAIDTEGRYLKTLGTVSISSDFTQIWGYSIKMRDDSQDGNLQFMAPADNREDAKEIPKEMLGFKGVKRTDQE